MSTDNPEASSQQPTTPAVNPGESPPVAGNQPAPPAAKPEPDDSIKLSKAAFEERLQRQSSSTLKKLFGTDDVDTILQQKKEYDELKAKSDEQRRQSLSEVERAKEDAARLLAEKSKLESQLLREKQTRIVQTEAQRLTGVMAEAGVNPKYSRHVLRDMGEDLLKTKTKAQIATMTDKDLKEYFKSYVKRNPAFANAGAPPPASPSEPASNGKPGGAAKPTPPQSGNSPQKTAKLGQPNSMTDNEWREYKRSNGLNFL